MTPRLPVPEANRSPYPPKPASREAQLGHHLKRALMEQRFPDVTAMAVATILAMRGY